MPCGTGGAGRGGVISSSPHEIGVAGNDPVKDLAGGLSKARETLRNHRAKGWMLGPSA